jgi:membrane dipeptidase
MTPLVADAHSDLLLELVHAEDELGEGNPLAARWLPLLERGGVGLQVCALYVDPQDGPERGLRALLRQVRAFKTAVRENADRVVAVETAADLDRGGIGLLLSLEGVSSFNEDGWLLDVLAALGVRMVSLTWNEQNAFAGGCDAKGGLSPLGQRLVDRLCELRIVVDLAHASPRTVDETLARVDGVPVVVSHAACRALHDHRRNLSDAHLRAVADTGGVLGLMPHPLVVGADTLDRFVDHVEHAAAVMGVDHVALGGDFLEQIARTLGIEDEVVDGVRAGAVIDGLTGPQDYPRLGAALRDRGWGDEDVAALLGANLVRVLRAVLP